MENLDLCRECDEETMDETHRMYVGMCEACFSHSGALTQRVLQETYDLI